MQFVDFNIDSIFSGEYTIYDFNNMDLPLTVKS